MKLEEEIKQTKPFKSELQKLMVNLAFTSSWLNGILVQRLKSFGLSPQQFNVLRILNGRHPKGYCNQEITQRMIDKSSNSSRIVDKLLEKGLVQRKEDLIDRRLVDIKITEAGIQLLNDFDARIKSENQPIINLSDEKASQMNAWLDEMRG